MTHAALALILLAPALAADTPPPPVPPTREAMLEALEASKHNVPRLPLPPLTEAEKAAAGEHDFAKGKWGIVNNGRMRKFYLPAGVVSGGFSREPDPVMSLGYPFQTQLFWIVSRGNNCTYCMGHQESKLAAAGLTQDQIAALDGDWAALDPKARAAFVFTRKLSTQPYALADSDIQALRAAGYTDTQILEIALVVGGFDAMNRWTGALRIPQEEHHVFKRPIPAAFQQKTSAVAPVADEGPSARPAKRPPLESPAELDALLSEARTRKPRLPLASEEAARAALGEKAPDGPLPAWMRLLATFPRSGVQRIGMHVAAANDGELPARYKAIIAYIAARHDRAWYALDLARRDLLAQGFSENEIVGLDSLGAPLSREDAARLANREAAVSAADQVVASFARKLTVDPALIDDADIARLRLIFNDKQTAEAIFHVTEAAFFNRVTEAAGLTVESR